MNLQSEMHLHCNTKKINKELYLFDIPKILKLKKFTAEEHEDQSFPDLFFN